MKIKYGFTLRNIAGKMVVLPFGASTVDFTGMLSLNESGVLLWRMLEGGCTREDMAKALTDEYDVSYDMALNDVNEFLENLIRVGCIED